MHQPAHISPVKHLFINVRLDKIPINHLVLKNSHQAMIKNRNKNTNQPAINLGMSIQLVYPNSWLVYKIYIHL